MNVTSAVTASSLGFCINTYSSKSPPVYPSATYQVFDGESIATLVFPSCFP